jgi:hypothetical protein
MLALDELSPIEVEVDDAKLLNAADSLEQITQVSGLQILYVGFGAELFDDGSERWGPAGRIGHEGRTHLWREELLEKLGNKSRRRDWQRMQLLLALLVEQDVAEAFDS